MHAPIVTPSVNPLDYNGTPLFRCYFFKSYNGSLYPDNGPAPKPYNWRAQVQHPVYTGKFIFAYAKSRNGAYKALFDKWTYLKNRGVDYGRDLTSQVCGHVKAQRARNVNGTKSASWNPELKKWAVSCEHPIIKHRGSLTAYADTIEEAVEEVEDAYWKLKHVHRAPITEDAVYDRLVKRGYTEAECNGEPGDNGDSLHKPGLTKAKLDEELDNIHYRMVCVRMSRADRNGKLFYHGDNGCCDPEERPIEPPQLTADLLDRELMNYILREAPSYPLDYLWSPEEGEFDM